jgi:glycine cleavage system H protein
MTIPDDLYYAESHEWLRLHDDGTATVGITDFAQGELGDVVFLEFEPEDSEFEAGDVFGTIEAVKTVSELYLPVSGTILEVNEVLEDEPELVNQDPYGDGWMVKIEVEDADEADDLMDAEAYESLV